MKSHLNVQTKMIDRMSRFLVIVKHKSDILKKDGIVLVEQIFYTNAITLSIANIKFDQPQSLCTR